MTCRHCGKPLAFDADPRRIYCSASCRTLAYRRRKQDEARAFRSAAADLLVRQSHAIAEGADPILLAEIEREARGLFGDA